MEPVPATQPSSAQGMINTGYGVFLHSLPISEVLKKVTMKRQQASPRIKTLECPPEAEDSPGTGTTTQARAVDATSRKAHHPIVIIVSWN